MDRGKDQYVRTNKGERAMKRIAGYLLFLLAAVALFTGCAATEVTSVWKDPDYQGRPKKILVYTVLKNQLQRRIYEDEFVAHFKYRGINAVPGYSVVPGEELAKKEVLEEKLKSLGFDALLLTQVTGTKTELVQVPGTVNYQPMYSPMYQPAPYYRSWPGYYNAGYHAMYTPSYTAEDFYVMTETSLFDVASEKLIWSAAAATRIGGKDQKLIKDYVATMMDAMRKDKVVP
jgi:hypothetical protein